MARAGLPGGEPHGRHPHLRTLRAARRRLRGARPGGRRSPGAERGLPGFGAVFAWFKFHEAESDETFSVTGVVAALLVFALGALAVAGDPQVAAATGVATAGLLASRVALHRFLARLSWNELRSALLLAAMTAIVLPVLPNAPVDPWGGVNPREIWLFMVLTAGVSFAGYVAVKIAGPTRGVILTGLAGALVSSTAVTVAFARRAAAGEPAGLLSAAACLAGLVSIMRVVTIVAVVRPGLAPFVGPALIGAAAFGSGALALLRRSDKNTPVETRLENPFELALSLFSQAPSRSSRCSARGRRNASGPAAST